MTPKLKFAEGEKVLCFHGPLIYEAKALKSSVTKDKQIKYYIHYAGWNKNWDEWVPENRVLKYNEANVQRQKEVIKQHSSASKSRKGTPKGKKGDASAAAGGSTPKDGAVSSGGSESRASTPSKELPTTPLAAPASASANTSSTTTAATTGSRSSSRSKQTPSTPAAAKESHDAGGAGSATKKDDAKEDVGGSGSSSNKEEIAPAKDEQPPKKKRGGSTSNNSDKSVGSAGAAANTTPSTPTTTPTPLNIAAVAPVVAAAAAATTSSSSSGGSRLDAHVESEETFLSKIEVKIKIPDELKQCLADDWDAITRQHKLIDIPAKITVQDIVDQYVAHKKSAKSSSASKEVAIADVLNGVIEYFNVMLGSQLLYKFERPQYAEILQQHPETPLTKLYGAFHLLRLFVKLGSMLGFSALDEKSMQMLLAHLNDFLKFLVKNSATYFSMSNFVNASPEYHRNTQ